MQRILVLLAVGAGACGNGVGISAAERSLAENGLDSMDVDAAAVELIELTLSGDVDVTATPAAAATSSGTSAASRLSPAGCITSTLNANIATHVLTSCMGRRGRVLSGTAVSTWTQAGSCLRVEHVTTGFTISGRSAMGSLSTTICRTGTTETRERELTFTTTTRRDVAIQIDGTWQTSFDTATRCATRSGSATVTLGGRTIDRGDTDLTWCEPSARRDGSASATDGPTSFDVITLSGGELRLASPLSVRVHFLGDGRYEIEDTDQNFLGGSTDGTGI